MRRRKSALFLGKRSKPESTDKATMTEVEQQLERKEAISTAAEAFDVATAPRAARPSSLSSSPQPKTPSRRSVADYTLRSPSRDSVISPLSSPSGGKSDHRPYSRQSPSITVSPQREHRLTRSISASISATLSTPPRPPALDVSQVRVDRRVVSQGAVVKRANTMLATVTRRPTDQFATNAASGATNAYHPGQSPQSIHNNIHETSNKRMATLEYMRTVYEGDVYHLSTVSHSQAQLGSLPSMHGARIGRRATNYLVLGAPLSSLLETYGNNPLEYLKALNSLLNEYETYCSLSTDSATGSMRSGRMGQMFKSGMRNVKSRRTSGAADSIMSSDASMTNGSSLTLSALSNSPDSVPPTPTVNSFGHDFQYLSTPNLPFDPDFNTTLGTLIDVLISAYRDLLTLLPQPENCTPAIGDAYQKADKAMRKTLMSGMVTELGDSARKETKSEIGGLGKMVLSNLV